MDIEITLGRWFSLAVKLATIISCLGSCTGYIIFFGTITYFSPCIRRVLGVDMMMIIGETLGQVFHCPSQRIVLMASVPLILLSWIRVSVLTFHSSSQLINHCTIYVCMLYNVSHCYYILWGNQSMYACSLRMYVLYVHCMHVHCNITPKIIIYYFFL